MAQPAVAAHLVPPRCIQPPVTKNHANAEIYPALDAASSGSPLPARDPRAGTRDDPPRELEAATASDVLSSVDNCRDVLPRAAVVRSAPQKSCALPSRVRVRLPWYATCV